MRVVSALPFGTVVRRDSDGLTVMVLAPNGTEDPMETDEIDVNPGGLIGFVLDRGDVASIGYWPLHGTCSITDIQMEGIADGWTVVS